MSRNLLAIRHLKRKEIEQILSLAKEFKRAILGGQEVPTLNGKVVGLLFFEGSTRTRISFEQAASYLGCRVTNFSGSGSSMSKGETLQDTILTLKHERLDALVMRHRASGSPALAAKYFGGPVLNAGDGEHEHPTQALADAMTIMEHRGKIDGLTVSIVGDVAHSRVARSNAWLLSKLGAQVRFVGPRTLMPRSASRLPGSIHYDLATGLENADVVMSLRLQKERMDQGLLSSLGEYQRFYQVTREALAVTSKHCLLMHPGPINRGIELDDSAADGENSMIHRQVENGIFVRMASLYWAFDPPGATPSRRKKLAAVEAAS